MPQPRMPKIPVRRRKVPMIEMTAAEKMRLSRPVMPMLNVDRRRTTFQQVELGYDEAAVRKEAQRCLRCDVCRRCGKCVEVCRDKMGIDALHLGYLDFDHPVKTDFRMTAENCITCGACAANCENNAMTLEEKDGKRMLKLCGTILNEQEIQTCDACGAKLPSAQYMAFISDKTADLTRKSERRLLCNDCQRRLTAKNQCIDPACQPNIKEAVMVFKRGNRVEVFQASTDEAWEPYMNDFIGVHGVVTDPDTSINDPDDLIEVSLQGKGTHRLPQDCLRILSDTQ
ncbi:MAG: hypothetical protein U5K27_10250 [Desulfotignum sp.]|nr:hypothetical protein [Desulfotignum sp.]